MKITVLAPKMLIISFVFVLLGYCEDDRPTIGKSDLHNCVLDTLIVRAVNLTIPGRSDRVIYHLIVEDWEKPVTWSLMIVSDKDTLFQKNSCDQKIDHFFYDPFYLGNCNSGYLVCKKLWYLEKIYNFPVGPVPTSNIEWIKEITENSKNLARQTRGEYGQDEQTALQNWDSFWEYYRDKPLITFRIQFAPEGSNTKVLAYHPKMNKLVPIYQE